MADFYTFDQLRTWADQPLDLSPPARLAVIGDPIGHSKSPQMHNPALLARAIPAQYIRVQVPSGKVPEAFECFVKSGFMGVNITIPHKFEALAAVDVVDPLARQLGAVNTLVIRDGKKYGYNTDGPGFLRSVRDAFGVDVKDLRLLILGAGGGAGETVFTQCLLHGCQEIIYSNRSLDKAVDLEKKMDQLNGEMTMNRKFVTRRYWNDYKLAEAAASVDLIVNATSVGMNVHDTPLLMHNVIHSRHLVYDMVYRASGRTDLIQAAQTVGASFADGMSLLLHQGALSFEHWFGEPAPLEAMRTGLRAAV